MRRSYQYRKLERHSRKPAELLLVPMIDIFTVLVTFLLMTAVFSRTVILQLNLPAAETEFREPPPGLVLEVIVRKDGLQVSDRNSGPLTPPFAKVGDSYNYDGLHTFRTNKLTIVTAPDDGGIDRPQQHSLTFAASRTEGRRPGHSSAQAKRSVGLGVVGMSRGP
jgi:hypothetical protein